MNDCLSFPVSLRNSFRNSLVHASFTYDRRGACTANLLLDILIIILVYLLPELFFWCEYKQATMDPPTFPDFARLRAALEDAEI